MLERCRCGDQAAWAILVREHERYVYAICTRGYGLAATDAEDVFQEAFARTWHRLARIPDERALRSWLGQVTRRLCIDRLRAGGRVRPDADAGARAADPVDELDRIELALDVQVAVGALPGDYREVLDRFFGRDQSYAQISADLGIPPGTVASRISRGLARLRDELSRDARSTTTDTPRLVNKGASRTPTAELEPKRR